MKRKRKTGRRLLGILLSLALMLGLMPGMSLTAYAADYENIEITSAVSNATSVSTLIDSLDGFCKLSKEEAKSWVPPTKSGNERLIRGYEGEYIRVVIFVNGIYANDVSVTLEQAKAYDGCKYYYAKKTVVAVNSVTLDTTATLNVGDVQQLTATVAPDNATDKTVTWTSSNTAVATVDNTGKVTAVAAGTATITATATNGTEDTSDDKTATCTVTVKAAPVVTFNANGGSGTMEPQTISAMTELTPNTFTREGYIFTGWNTAADGTGYSYNDGFFFIGDELTSDITLYAQWVMPNVKVGAVFKAGDEMIFDGTVVYLQADSSVYDSHRAYVVKVGTITDSSAVANSLYLNGGSQTYIAFDTSVPGANCIKITSGSGTESNPYVLELAVDKQAQTITASDVTATYGDTNKKVEATTDGNGAISYAVKDGSGDYIDVNATTGALTIKKVGTATVIVTAAETSTYAQATKEVTVTINKANAVAATVTANNRTYDGAEKPLVNVDNSTLAGGTMQYALGTKDAATEPYTTSIPSKTDAGTYYVWYKACGDANHSDSEPNSVSVTIGETETVATPTFSPDAGEYEESTSVTISCATEGATIYYTTDGNDPTSSSTTYNSAISVGETTTIKAIAVKDGMTDSEVASATYTINIPKEKAATPAFSPVEGTYTEAQSVTITCATEGATIHYTTDGSEPTSSSTTYNSAISVGETTTIKAIAVKDGMTDSSVASAIYTISEKPEPGTVATPIFSPEGGNYSDPQMVSINSETSGATIYYTTDGNDPTTESATFSSEITVTETTTIKAIAVKEGMTDSSVASVTYTISEEPEPSPEPEPGSEPEPSKDTRVDVGGLSDGDITDDLRAKGYDSVEIIESALQTALSIETEEKKENSELVDAKLMILIDEKWQEATLENFPEGGIDAILPYPDGTNGNEYSFSVAHMIGAGDRAGEIETPGTTNTASGISVHFNGLSPVMITWTKNSSPSKDDSKSEEKAHTHHFVWETVEATEENDGEFRYVCDICGGVQTRVPITAYYVFNKNTTEKIRKAGQGATVKIETSRWISFHKMVMQALADRPDVSLEVSFLDGEYKGNRVSFTIPAGTDTISLLDENGFSGFLYLAGKFGTAN